MERPDLTRGYMLVVSAAGVAVFVFALARVPLERVDLYYLLLFSFTIGLGSRVTVPIPQLKSHIAVSDIFIFLALLLFGGPLAVVLSAVEALMSSWRFCNKKITVLFNAASAALSTSTVLLGLGLLGLYSNDQVNRHDLPLPKFLIALSVMAIVYFVVNTSLAAVYDSLTEKKPIWDIWKRKYLWAFITFFIGAAGAGGLVQLSDRFGFGVVVAALPVILLVYASYRMYLTTVRMSLDQADQAEQYVKRIEAQSKALRESEERFRAAFIHAPIGIALVSFDGKWLKVNRALCEMLGYPEAELLGSTFCPMTSQDDLFDTLAAVEEIIKGKAADCRLEIRFIHKSGRTVWTSLNVSATDDVDSPSCNLVFQILDITEKKLAAEKLEHEASHDALTGLPNRAHFMRRLDAALAKIRDNPKYRVSVLFIDLDRFKFVNDSLGHHVGDELLVAIASRLGTSMRPPDMVARLGGDEFVVLVEGRYYAEKMTQIADRIQQKISAPFKLHGHDVFTTASIGILNATPQHRTADDILRDADTAMYQAKRAGKARHETFDETMRDAMRETLQLESDLRRAVQNEELEVWYQPIFSLNDDRLYSVEALVRWQHSTIGFVEPDRFVPLAEEIGLMDSLGDLILRTACERMRPLQISEEARDFKLSVNLSSRQFGDEKLVERIAAILGETDFPADRLKLEITETVFFEYHERAVEVLHRLRSMGIEIDIDDFGTGYSNLGYLVRLPISNLKIDRSFVMMMDESPANGEVVRTVIALARNLGLKVIAEGIETNRHREALRDLGCDYGQGYLYARPMDAEAMEYFLTRRVSGEYTIVPEVDLPEYSTIQ